MKYKQWLNKWLELYVKPMAKHQTYIKYERNVRVHIIPALGDYDLKKLNCQVLQKFVAEMTTNYASNTINGLISILKKSLNMAVSAGVTDKCSADKIMRPRSNEKKIECFTVPEQKAIERAAIKDGSPKMLGIVLCLYTGLRIGELLSLKWEDVDLKKAIITVSKSCHYVTGKEGKYIQIVEPPKTQKSVRQIPIPKQLLPHIRGLKKKSQCEYVVDYKGKPVITRSMQYAFERLLKRLDIPHRGFHALRHTFATRALECGMDVKTLSEILGHKNAAITMERYAHSLIDHKRDVMNKLGKLLD